MLCLLNNFTPRYEVELTEDSDNKIIMSSNMATSTEIEEFLKGPLVTWVSMFFLGQKFMQTTNNWMLVLGY